MTVEVQLHVTDIDLRDPEIHAVIQAHLSDYAWSITSGITTMTVFSDGDVVADTVHAIRCAQHHGITVLRVYEDRVNVGEIARRIGDFSREAVRKWTADDTFPQPRTALNNDSARGAAMLWDWAEVVTWLQEHKTLALDEHLPTESQVAAINASLAGARDYASDAWHHFFAPHQAGTVKVYHQHVAASLTLKTAGWVTTTPSKPTHPSSPARELDYA
jgi:hypothetical protein